MCNDFDGKLRFNKNIYFSMSVYTHISAAEFTELLSHYDLGELESYEGIKAGITNTNYFLNTRTPTQNIQQFVFTVFEEDSADDLDYFLKLKAFLREQGIRCPMPMADHDGNFLRSLQNKPVAIVEKLSGHTVEDITTHHCRIIGQGLAKLHTAAKSFPLRRKNQRGTEWRRTTFDKLADKLSEEDKQLLEKEINAAESLNLNQLPQSTIHCDLFWDNVLFYNEGKNTQLGGLIDFYYACDGYCLYDLAIVANDWCTDANGKMVKQKLSALLKHYHAERPFTDDENLHWHSMLKIAALRFWLSRLQDKLFPKEGELTFIKDPNEIKQILQYHLDNKNYYLHDFL